MGGMPGMLGVLLQPQLAEGAPGEGSRAIGGGVSDGERAEAGMEVPARRS